jgi:hypothetical protein
MKILFTHQRLILASKMWVRKNVPVLGQFLLRGLDKVRAEWKLVTLAWNLKRMLALIPTG